MFKYIGGYLNDYKGTAGHNRWATESCQIANTELRTHVTLNLCDTIVTLS